jgi:hypothetical protein
MRLRKSDAPVGILICLTLALVLGFARWRSAPSPDVPTEEAGPPRAASVGGGGPALDDATTAALIPSVEDIAKKFGPSIRPSAPSSLRVKATNPLPKADWLRAVGAFEDQAGICWLFIKDEKSGRVIQLRSDGIETEAGRVLDASAPELLIELESIGYSIRGR